MGYGHRFVPGVAQIPAPAPEEPAPGPENWGEWVLTQLEEFKRFRALLDEMTLNEAIDKICEETDQAEWWSVGIMEGMHDEWTELFDRLLGESGSDDAGFERNLWIWKRFFDELIHDLEHPGAPADPVDPVKIDSTADKVSILEERVTDVEGKLVLVPLGPMPAVEEDPAYPTVPGRPNVPDHSTDPVDLSNRIKDYLDARKAYDTAVLFSLGWTLEHCRVCLAELQRNKAPGTDTDLFKANLTSANNALIILEQGGVFGD